MATTSTSANEQFINEIIVLFNGYSKLENSDLMLANCTCTLIKGRHTITIVDTRTAWDGGDVINELSKYNIQPSSITHVVCTHGHSDHIGCNYLFTNAKVHVVGVGISNQNKYFLHDFSLADYAIDDGVDVTATPGHTLDSVSVVVQHTNLGDRVAICGDLFENGDDVFDSSVWLSAGSEAPDKQRFHRHRMSTGADTIIPGHGPRFSVTDDIRKRLQCDLEGNLTA